MLFLGVSLWMICRMFIKRAFHFNKDGVWQSSRVAFLKEDITNRWRVYVHIPSVAQKGKSVAIRNLVLKDNTLYTSKPKIDVKVLMQKHGGLLIRTKDYPNSMIFCLKVLRGFGIVLFVFGMMLSFIGSI